MDDQKKDALNETPSLEQEIDGLFATDTAKEEEGIWIRVPGTKDGEMFIVSTHSPDVKDFLAHQQRKYTVLYQAKKTPPATDLDADRTELVAKKLLRNWRGKSFGALAFTRTNVFGLLRKYPMLRDWIINSADDRTNFREEEVDALGET